MKIDRYMGILSYLMDHQKTTAKELSQFFSVSVRTIMRDIDGLTLAGIPIYVTRGKNGGIFFMDTFKSEKPPLTKDEMTSITNSLDNRYQVLGDDVTFNAILKLNSSNQASHFDIDLSLSQGNLELRKIVFQLLDAIKKRVTISYDYINSQGIESTKLAEPYRIVYKDKSWYLDVYDKEKQLFLCTKFQECSPLLMGKDLIEESILLCHMMGEHG